MFMVFLLNILLTEENTYGTNFFPRFVTEFAVYN